MNATDEARMLAEKDDVILRAINFLCTCGLFTKLERKASGTARSRTIVTAEARKSSSVKIFLLVDGLSKHGILIEA